MPTVGIRELRADLSKIVKRVKAGEEIVITERGKPIAKIVPATQLSKLDMLVAKGEATPPRNRGSRYVPEPIEGAGPLSDLVIEGRR